MTRLIETLDQEKRVIDTLTPLREKVQFHEAQMEEWQRRFPARSFGEEMEDIQCSIELQRSSNSSSDTIAIGCGNFDMTLKILTLESTF